MDKRMKKLNDRILGLRQAYDEVEKTAEELLDQASERLGGDEKYLVWLTLLARHEGSILETKTVACLAQFGVIRLLLNKAERDHSDILLGIDPNEPSVP